MGNRVDKMSLALIGKVHIYIVKAKDNSCLLGYFFLTVVLKQLQNR